MTLPVIAIDGPAGSGKSTTARAVADRLGVPFLETGALYRALTLAALDAGTELTGQRLIALARSSPVRFALTNEGVRPDVAGVDVSASIRADRVTRLVSQVSAIPEVRSWVNQLVRTLVAEFHAGVVLEGRDIGTVVFPDAVLKIFLTADPAARAERRLRQDAKLVDPAAIARETAALRARDDADSSRAVAPLRQAADAVVIDTSALTFEDQVECIVRYARNALEFTRPRG
jgi:cytidylate kinase